VLCLAFPLRPPGRDVSRLDELELVRVPALVVQGETDRFGIPPPASRRIVVTVPGDHALRKDKAAVRDAIARWLNRLLARSARS
jgi:uncharacterized protein